MRFKPIYRLVIGSSEIDVTQNVSASTVVQIDVERNMDLFADRCEVRLAPLGGVQPVLDDDIAIELGFDDRLFRVFTGKISEIVPEVTTVRILGLSPVQALQALRVEQTYEGRTAGQIVNDLAMKAKLRTGTISDGIRLLVYVIDGRLNAARHIHRLAERCGFDAYVSPEGALEFRSFTSAAATHVFTYGENILDFSLTTRSARVAEVIVAGRSAASAEGDEAVSWLTKNFQAGRASGGGGTETVLIEDPAIRTTEGANLRAEGVLRRAKQRTIIGSLRALGRPEIKLGDALRIEEAPDERLNQTFQVRSVRQRLNRERGLVTEIVFWGMP